MYNKFQKELQVKKQLNQSLMEMQGKVSPPPQQKSVRRFPTIDTSAPSKKEQRLQLQLQRFTNRSDNRVKAFLSNV